MDNRPIQTKTLLDAVTITGKSKVFAIPAEDRITQAFVNGAGAAVTALIGH